jgi:hypothetical protein
VLLAILLFLVTEDAQLVGADGEKQLHAALTLDATRAVRGGDVDFRNASWGECGSNGLRETRDGVVAKNVNDRGGGHRNGVGEEESKILKLGFSCVK